MTKSQIARNLVIIKEITQIFPEWEGTIDCFPEVGVQFWEGLGDPTEFVAFPGYDLQELQKLIKSRIGIEIPIRDQ